MRALQNVHKYVWLVWDRVAFKKKWGESCDIRLEFAAAKNEWV